MSELKIPGQRDMLASFAKGIAHPTKGKVDVARARHLKDNQAGSLRKKMSRMCPRCHKGKMKRQGSDEIRCNACSFSKYWRKI